MNSSNKKKLPINVVIYRFVIRQALSLYLLFLNLFKNKRQKPTKDKATILVTGTFYSDQWLITHLKPLAASIRVKSVIMVSSTKVPEIEGVSAVYPPVWMCKFIGGTPSRLFIFVWYAVLKKPDIIGGFHLLINGLVAILLAKLIGARSIYICGGGPREVLGGGYLTENKIFNKIRYADSRIEKSLLKSLQYCDLIITMGTSAIEYFRKKGVKSRCEIVPGGFSVNEFYPTKEKKEYDLILIGRLSKVKQVDLFIKSILNARKSIPNLNAVIVGDGPDKLSLELLSKSIALDHHILFAGWQDDIGHWLRKSRVFMLTSSSEGLSQALIQAMMCGLPAIVSDVGDLDNLVENGKNGFTVKDITIEVFTNKIIEIFKSEHLLKEFSEAAFETSKRYRTENVILQWNKILSSI